MPFLQTAEHVQPLLFPAVVQQAGDEEPPRNVAGHGVAAGEDQARLVGVQAKEVLQHAELLLRPVLDRLLGKIGPQHAAGLGRERPSPGKGLPTGMRIGLAALDHVGPHLPRELVVTDLLLGRKVDGNPHHLVIGQRPPLAAAMGIS